MSTPRDEPLRRRLPFSRRRLDRGGTEIVRRLQEAGFEAYFVGGCVRDLLLGRQPKDFDIATSARPNQVRRLFRRSRIIGRRFRLAHVYSGREVFEVATFRRVPPELEEGEVQMIREDNTFGTAAEDARRRDFTVNALFLDPVEGEIVDWVGGFEDLAARRLRSIGDPRLRFREDPVRILRLLKFFRRLGLEPGPEEAAAARELAPHIAEAAPPRVAEEVFRLMVTGDMAGVVEDLMALGVLTLVLPEVDAWLRRGGDRLDRLLALLEVFDRWVRDGGDPCYSLRLAVLFCPLVEEEMDPATRTVDARDPAQVVARILGDLQRRARLPRWVLSRCQRLLLVQQRLDPPPGGRRRRRRKGEAAALLGQEWFADSLDLLRCRLEAAGRDLEPYDRWREQALSREGEAR